MQFANNPYQLTKGCDCLLLLTDWEEFKKINFKKIKSSMRQAMIFDGRNQFSDLDLNELGFEYYGVGRGGSKVVSRT